MIGRQQVEGRVRHLYGRHFRHDSGIKITDVKGNRQNERTWNQLFSWFAILTKTCQWQFGRVKRRSENCLVSKREEPYLDGPNPWIWAQDWESGYCTLWDQFWLIEQAKAIINFLVYRGEHDHSLLLISSSNFSNPNSSPKIVDALWTNLNTST